jgi:hypothetical protein
MGRHEKDIADAYLYIRIPRHHRRFARHVCHLCREACTFMIRPGPERGLVRPQPVLPPAQRSDLGRYA